MSTVLATQTHHDRLLSALAPIGLAAAAGTALVVDLENPGVSYPGERTLADLVRDGPRRADLIPERDGVALLANGGVDMDEARETVELLISNWPATVLRTMDGDVPAPVVPVIPLYPGWMARPTELVAVWQTMSGSTDAPGPGPVLPAPGRSMIVSVCSGRLPTKGRWVRSWGAVWELPWR
ncbi:MAG: hypothetical protein GEU79_00685 [Acidimicrobiia bacterium]|nr:hypothetical protein [Acidimicrobiia bacterium]